MNRQGKEIYDIANGIYPICRSLTGDGVRETLRVLAEYVPELRIHEVPSGTQVFDWKVPKEWKIRDAYIQNSAGEKIIDFKKNNLHVMGYSVPVDKYVDLETLKQYLYTEQKQPDVIPYVTSYYKERYGFCMSENQKNSLEEGMYHIYIDSELFDGHLTYGEIVIPGESEEEIFFSTNICHPSLANNECSGPALAVYLAKWLKTQTKRHYTYRFVFIPETIGSITYLSKHIGELKKKMAAGFVLSCVGDNKDYSMIHSRYSDTYADRVLKNVLDYYCDSYSDYSFLDRGSDERQYNAPGVDLPVVAFCRSKFGQYEEYHTSADNMEYVSEEGFQGSFEVMTRVVKTLEHNKKYRIRVLCEPQLGKSGLYPTVSKKGSYDAIKNLRDFIAYADGKNDLIDISDYIHCSTDKLIEIVNKLTENGLLEIEK